MITSWIALGVEDGTVCRDTTGTETVHQLFGQSLVGDDADCLGIEFLGHLESKLGEIGLSVLAGIVEHGIWGIMKYLVDELITESLPNVRRSPEQANGDTALENGVGARANTGTGGDEDHPAEHRNNPQDAVDGNTADPQLGWRVVDHVRRPVTSARDDERELVPSRFGDSGKCVPFPERRMSDTDPSSCGRAGYDSIVLIPCWLGQYRTITYCS